MTYSSYDEYLLSDEWASKSRKRMAIDGYCCTMCGCTGTQGNPLQCHHVTYKNLYHEDIWKDLLTLCKSCHRQVHTMMNRQTSASGQRGWKDTLKPSCHVLEVGDHRELQELRA